MGSQVWLESKSIAKTGLMLKTACVPLCFNVRTDDLGEKGGDMEIVLSGLCNAGRGFFTVKALTAQ